MNEIINQIASRLLKQQARLVTAESCTGGQLAAALTRKAGSSHWFECGWVTYSNASKQALLGVPELTLGNYGAVSEQTVLAMASGALTKINADYSVAVSGIAGPGGGSDDKPVGTVYLAWASKNKAAIARHCIYSGDREQVQSLAVKEALDGLLVVIR